jgi:acetyl-CoA carboxylase carboxyltransferase component
MGNLMGRDKETDEIRRRRDLAKREGGEEVVRRQHEKGRLTIRERVAKLADERSIREIAAAPYPDTLRKELEDKLAAGRSPFPPAEGFSVHELIDPRETRPRLWDWLDWIEPRRGIAIKPYTTTMRP